MFNLLYRDVVHVYMKVLDELYDMEQTPLKIQIYNSVLDVGDT